MKIKRFNQLNEGTWDLPRNTKEGQKYINKLEKYIDDIYHVFGDDEVMDGLQSALSRMKELLDNIN